MSSSTPEPPLAEGRRDALVALFDATQELVGGDFRSLDDSSPRECKTVDGQDGVQFSLGRSAVVPISMEDAKALAQEVVDLWTSHGYTMHTKSEGVLGYSSVGENGSRSAIEFAVNDKARSLSGGSDCVLGGIADVKERLGRQ